MIGRLKSDQRGIALPVAVMMVVLIGVMGAGLLTFVRTGLDSTLEVNQGQRALKMADAGVQAAKRQLAANATTTQYNGTTNLGLTPPDTESTWSYVGTGRTLSLRGTGTLLSPECDQCINVKIRWLQPSMTDSDVRDVNRAPQNASQRDFFRVVSEATAGNARRRIEAIYYVEGRDIPRAFYTPGSITISGTSNITNMSMFSRGNVTINGGATFSGTDFSYNNWNVSPFNTTARRSSHPSGPFVTVPGVGTTGTITGGGNLGTRDYGSNTNPQFILKNPPDGSQTTSQISFPFDYRSEPDLEDLRLAAQQQGNYYELAADTNTDITGPGGLGAGPKWPTNSAVDTVVFVRFTSYQSGNNLGWNVGSSGTTVKGTFVIENSTFTTGQNKACLNGYIIIRGVPTNVESYKDTGGNSCLQGAVNSSGGIRIAGNVSPFTLEGGNRPGFYAVSRWSWREQFQP